MIHMPSFVAISAGGVVVLVGAGIASVFTGWLIRVLVIDRRRR